MTSNLGSVPWAWNANRIESSSLANRWEMPFVHCLLYGSEAKGFLA